MADRMITVEVVHAGEARQVVCKVELCLGSTVAQAVEASSIAETLPDGHVIDDVGIFGRKVALDQHSARGRDGITGPRNAGAIGFASLRGGTVTGDHSVIFAGPYERIELSHKAEDRMIFARGALKAAMWAQGKKPGYYTMADVLGINGL